MYLGGFIAMKIIRYAQLCSTGKTFQYTECQYIIDSKVIIMKSFSLFLIVFATLLYNWQNYECVLTETLLTLYGVE